jgi:hypothetical protein
MPRIIAACLLIAATSTASLPLAAGFLVAGLFCATISKSDTPA